MKLPNIKILDESNKILHEKSEDVVFPLDSKTKKLIDDSLTYLEMSQIEEYSEKYGANFLLIFTYLPSSGHNAK